MKVFKMFVLSLLVLPVVSRASQNNVKGGEVSTVVKNSFSEKWPGMNVEKWKKNDDQYVAVFTKGDKKLKSSFDENGNWLKTASSVKWEALPAQVRKAYYASNFRWLHWESAKKLQTKNYNEVYLIEGDNMNKESEPIGQFKVWIAPDGKIVKTDSDI